MREDPDDTCSTYTKLLGARMGDGGRGWVGVGGMGGRGGAGVTSCGGDRK